MRPRDKIAFASLDMGADHAGLFGEDDMIQERLVTGKPRIDCSQEEWNLRVDLACAYRLAHHFGWHQLIYNHLTARVPGPDDHFLINPFGLMYREVTASNLLKIDTAGNKLLPSPYAVLQAGFVVHRSVHMHRHDLVSVMHAHTVPGVAVSCQAEGLLPLNLNSMTFAGRIAYHDCEGITIDESESDRIAASLGDKSVMLLRNHGLLTAGKTIGDAFAEFYHLDLACQIQLQAQASGARLVYPSPQVIEATQRLREKGTRGEKDRVSEQNQILWAAMVRWMLDIDPGFTQ
jgi:ribulose-5-phosphate 4-epimerase/fuculose-1-phosphate aldolase